MCVQDIQIGKQWQSNAVLDEPVWTAVIKEYDMMRYPDKWKYTYRVGIDSHLGFKCTVEKLLIISTYITVLSVGADCTVDCEWVSQTVVQGQQLK